MIIQKGKAYICRRIEKWKKEETTAKEYIDIHILIFKI